MAKMMRLLSEDQDLDIEALQWPEFTGQQLQEIAGGCELSLAAPREHCENVQKLVREQVKGSDLTLATEFVAIYLFIKVKASRPNDVSVLGAPRRKSVIKRENGRFS